MNLLRNIAVLVVSSLVGQASTQDLNFTLPSFDPDLIRFLYYSGSANGNEIVYNNATTLGASGFQPNTPTIFLIDGFLSNSTNSNMTKFLQQTLVREFPARNIIIVDWGELSGGTSGFTATTLTTDVALVLYPDVILNVPIVGQRVADFISFLEIGDEYVWIIGHSIGAHIAGYAGQMAQEFGGNLSHITGLDPAGPLGIYGLPLVDDLPTQQKLSACNAQWVDAVHTGRGLTSRLGLPIMGTGFGTTQTNVGDVDIFVNGGYGQPSCNQTNPIDQANCDHIYSWKWYNQTITTAKNGYSCNAGLLGNCFSGSGLGSGSSIVVGYQMAAGTTRTYYTKDPVAYPG